MARYLFFCLILLLLVLNQIQTMFIDDDNDLMNRRHIGAARESRYRAQKKLAQSILPLMQQDSSKLSPEYLRSRWLELFQEQNSN